MMLERGQCHCGLMLVAEGAVDAAEAGDEKVVDVTDGVELSELLELPETIVYRR